MTMRKFVELCDSILINPQLAIENEVIKTALKNRAGEIEIFELLQGEF